jgi:hypothetical protein
MWTPEAGGRSPFGHPIDNGLASWGCDLGRIRPTVLSNRDGLMTGRSRAASEHAPFCRSVQRNPEDVAGVTVNNLP